MFDSFAEEVGLDEVRRTQRSAQNINPVLVDPLPSTEHIGRVGEDVAITNVVDVEGCQWVPWSSR